MLINNNSLVYISLYLITTAILLSSLAPSQNNSLLLDSAKSLPNYENLAKHNNLIESIQYSIFEGPKARAVARLSFLASAKLYKTEYKYWKLENVALHILISLAILGFTYQIAKLSNAPSPLLIATVASCLWLSHPLHISSYLYTVQRITLLSTLFSILALHLLTLATQSGNLKTRLTLYSLFSTLVILSCLSKEIGILTIPIALSIILITKSRFSGRQSEFQLLTFTLLFISITILFYLVYFYPELISKGYELKWFDIQERAAVQLNFQINYLGWIINPFSTYGFFHDDINPALFQYSIESSIQSILFYCAAITISIIIYKNNNPIPLIGLTIFIISQALEATIIPLELIFEHRMYYPSIGIIIMATSILTATKNRIITSILAILMITANLYATTLRAQTWSSPESQFQEFHRIHPNSTRINTKLASLTINVREEKNPFFQRLPTSLKTSFRSVKSCIDKKRFSTKSIYVKALPSQARNITFEQIFWLANMHLDNVCSTNTEDFISLLTQIETSKGLSRHTKGSIAIYKAHLQHKQHKTQEAIDTLRGIEKLLRDNPYPNFLAAKWSYEEKINSGKSDFTKGLKKINFWNYRQKQDAKILANDINLSELYQEFNTYKSSLSIQAWK